MNEETLFHMLLQASLHEREEILQRECANQPELRARMMQLLANHQSSLDAPTEAREPSPAAEDPPEKTLTHHSKENELLASRVIAGRYKLLEVIGQGGMGVVWMADQLEPVKRRVALKLIRTERVTSSTILARFEAERQAIALMDHPHIARLMDAGTWEDSPYFVMELVRGVPLNEYCDTHRLSIADRLVLFTQICGAVQHAHQKGIIHRDLKPGNILVSPTMEKQCPKLSILVLRKPRQA